MRGNQNLDKVKPKLASGFHRFQWIDILLTHYGDQL